MAIGVWAPLAFSVCVNADEPSIADFKPSWTVGQHWRVDITTWSEAPSKPPEELANWSPTQGTTTFRLDVEEMVEIDGEACHQIRLEVVALNGEPKTYGRGEYRISHRLYLRASDNSLKMVQVSQGVPRTYDGGSEPMRDYPPRKFEPGVIAALGHEEWVLPVFSTDPKTREVSVRVDPNGYERVGHGERCRQSEEFARQVVDGQEIDVLEITLEQHNSVAPPWLTKTTQTWVKGKPWWIEARCEENGRERYTAKLIQD
jgi:hypothetical protein